MTTQISEKHFEHFVSSPAKSTVIWSWLTFDKRKTIFNYLQKKGKQFASHETEWMITKSIELEIRGPHTVDQI